MRRRFAIVSVAVPVVAGAIITAYGIRQYSGQQRDSVTVEMSTDAGSRSNDMLRDVTAPGMRLAPVSRIQTAAQASRRALEVAHEYGATHPRVVNVEMLSLVAAMASTQRDSADDFDLGAAGYGESAHAQATWRVQLDDAVFCSGVTSAAVLPTAILVLASVGGTLIDMSLGYPVPQ